MNSFVYIIASTLIVAILYAIFRILRLLDIIKGRKEENISSFQNRLQPFLLMAMLIGGLVWFFSYGTSESEKYNVPVASEHGVFIEDMFWTTMVLCLIALIVTHFLLFLFAYIYRHNKNRRASFYHENDKLEIIWTVIPGLVLMGLIFNGWRHWVDITSAAPAEAEVIEIVGYQFAWAARYGGKDKEIGRSDYRLIDAENRIGIDFSDKASMDDFMPREIYIPKGRPVKFEIRALDVIHSFFSPHFRMQMYAVPGMGTTFWITPSKTTKEMRNELDNPEFNYEIACNKICGKGHFAMRHIIVVLEAEEYDTWYAEQESWLKKHPDYSANIDNRQPTALNQTP